MMNKKFACRMGTRTLDKNLDYSNDWEYKSSSKLRAELCKQTHFASIIKQLPWHYTSQALRGYKHWTANPNLHLLRLPRRWSLCDCAGHLCVALLCIVSTISSPGRGLLISYMLRFSLSFFHHALPFFAELDRTLDNAIASLHEFW